VIIFVRDLFILTGSFLHFEGLFFSLILSNNEVIS
jgi:hypothetical protein